MQMTDSCLSMRTVTDIVVEIAAEKTIREIKGRKTASFAMTSSALHYAPAPVAACEPRHASFLASAQS